MVLTGICMISEKAYSVKLYLMKIKLEVWVKKNLFKNKHIIFMSWRHKTFILLDLFHVILLKNLSVSYPAQFSSFYIKWMRTIVLNLLTLLSNRPCFQYYSLYQWIHALILIDCNTIMIKFHYNGMKMPLFGIAWKVLIHKGKKCNML